MKRKNLIGLVGIALIIGVLGFLTSCTEITPPLEDCELYGYGTVNVKNDLGYKAEVDVTWGNIDINDERVVYSGNTTTYREIPSGNIYLWVSYYVNELGYVPFWTSWEYNSEYLSDCENMTYRWYISYSKKSTDGTLSLDIIKDGELVKTINTFKNEIIRK